MAAEAAVFRHKDTEAAHSRIPTNGSDVPWGESTRTKCYLPPAGWRKLMRKLKKQSRNLCSLSCSPSATRKTAFRCHYYDPLTYAQNFESGADGEDSDHFRAFSDRFLLKIQPAAQRKMATIESQ